MRVTSLLSFGLALFLLLSFFDLSLHGEEVSFVRGDANEDRALDIADPVAIFLYLFHGRRLPILDAADANDDGRVDISDGIYILNYLFAGGRSPPPPFPASGPDPTPDSLDRPAFRFIDPGWLPRPERLYDDHALFADVDGDGDQDIVAVSHFGYRFYINRRPGVFVDESPQRAPVCDTSQSRMAAAGDVNGDGELDIAVVRFEEPLNLLLNMGGGSFGLPSFDRFPARSYRSFHVTLFDADGDGHLDILSVPLYLNDGTGHFTVAEEDPPLAGGEALAAGDVDGDGDVDVFMAPWFAPPCLSLNRGNGQFEVITEEGIPAASVAYRDAELADLDADGDLDLLLGIQNLDSTPAGNQLWINDGRGVFTNGTAERLPADPGDSLEIETADVDNDGDLDIYASVGTREGGRIFLNTGSGYFMDVTRDVLPVYSDPSRRAEFGDADGDGDLDLLEGDSVLLVNTLVHDVVDEDPPSLTVLEPLDGSTVDVSDPTLVFAYEDATSGADQRTLRVEVNGIDLSAQLALEARRATLQLSSALPAGENRVLAEIADNSGNTARVESTFTVSPGFPPFSVDFATKDAVGQPRSLFAPGELIELEILLRNRTGVTKRLWFPDSQRFDFVVEGMGHTWRWSDGLAFLDVVLSLPVGPDSARGFTTLWSQIDNSGGTVPRGTYTVRGWITTGDPRLPPIPELEIRIE